MKHPAVLSCKNCRLPVESSPSCYTFSMYHWARIRIGGAVIAAAAALVFCGAFEASAQQQPDEAKSISNLLEHHYHNAKTLRAVFLERYTEGPKDSRVESGTVFFKRPGQMRWEYDSPEKKLFLVDGKNAWFYVPYDRTVTKAPVRESSDFRTPLALLTGKADLSRLCSKIDLTQQPGVPDTNAVLRCLPKGENKASGSRAGSAQPEMALPGDVDFTEVLLEVDKSSGELARIEIREPGGIELEYRFGNWLQDLALPDATFRFQVPAGVAIVDGAALGGESH
jgi:outer membrane lipoprotein carrier protein